MKTYYKEVDLRAAVDACVSGSTQIYYTPPDSNAHILASGHSCLGTFLSAAKYHVLTPVLHAEFEGEITEIDPVYLGIEAGPEGLFSDEWLGKRFRVTLEEIVP